jgi:hypothetical protein
VGVARAGRQPARTHRRRRRTGTHRARRATHLHRRPERRNGVHLPRARAWAQAEHALSLRVTADNDSNAAQPFAATFATAPRGRAPFRFTSYGDLATPNGAWVLSSPQSRFAVQAVEQFQPLFHLLNGDLCYANLNPAHQPEVWRDFGNNNQSSAANRPWMPCPGNHEIEFNNGPQGLDSYLARYQLPENGTRFPGRWYSFRVSSVLFISLDADDVVYQDAAAFVAGPAPLVPAASTGHAPIEPGTSFYVRGYSNGEQTRWLEHTLRHAAHDDDIDWIVVQMHQDALSSSKTGNGSDKGIREAWLPLFDRYGVDLVLCGHDHDYERSYPVRGCNHRAGVDASTGEVVETLQPRRSARRPGPHHVRHERRHDPSDPRRRRHQRAARRVRKTRRPATRRRRSSRNRTGRCPARRRTRSCASPPTRSRTRSGRRDATRAPVTGSPCSTTIRASPAATRRSRCATTMRPAPTSTRARSTSCSRRSSCASSAARIDPVAARRAAALRPRADAADGRAACAR